MPEPVMRLVDERREFVTKAKFSLTGERNEKGRLTFDKNANAVETHLHMKAGEATAQYWAGDLLIIIKCTGSEIKRNQFQKPRSSYVLKLPEDFVHALGSEHQHSVDVDVICSYDEINRPRFNIKLPIKRIGVVSKEPVAVPVKDTNALVKQAINLLLEALK